MPAPLWKRLLSYLTEIHIETSGSEINPQLHVALVKGRYQLCTENAIYSYADLYDNFRQAYDLIDFNQLKIKKVLILGFGLGSIPVILEQRFTERFHYTAVEIDEAVLELANKYVMPDLSSPIDFYCTDALAYVHQCQEQFDLINVDVFLDDTIPEALEQIDFLEQLDSILAPNGLILYNRLAYTSDDIKNARAFYEQKFEPAFPNGTFLEVKGNWMLSNRKDIIKK